MGSRVQLNWRSVLAIAIGLGFFSPLPPVEARKINFPSNLGFPGRRVPGGSRGEQAGRCLKGSIPPVALMPASNLGRTTREAPTLFFYVPETSAAALELVWYENGAAGATVLQHKQIYQPSEKAGVVGLRLLKPLAVGKQYQWQLAIVCNSKNRALDKVLEGTIERIQSDAALRQTLAKTAPKDRFVRYAEAGIWLDSLATLAAQRYDRPTDAALKADWEALLTADGVRLDAVHVGSKSSNWVQEPLVPAPNAPKLVQQEEVLIELL